AVGAFRAFPSSRPPPLSPFEIRDVQANPSAQGLLAGGVRAAGPTWKTPSNVFPGDVNGFTGNEIFFCKLTFPALPKKQNAEWSEPYVKKLGDVNVPKFVEDVLGLGPKFYVALRTDKTELHGVNRGKQGNTA
ncbi:hypothetical protein MTO96_042687, partial [Rhipicephalus appendiculatus]